MPVFRLNHLLKSNLHLLNVPELVWVAANKQPIKEQKVAVYVKISKLLLQNNTFNIENLQ